ncbi:MAG: DUF4199 family protein [Chitinophagaceae bacterium]|nr:MAG: DUF4199 family protein [Chitinophagaceae bacterium]
MRKKQTHIPLAIAATLLSVAVAVLLHFTKDAYKSWTIYCVLMPFVVLVILNAQRYSRVNQAEVRFGNILGSGFKMALLVAALMGMWGILIFYVFPETENRMLYYAEQGMRDKGLKGEMLETKLMWSQKYMKLFSFCYFLFTFLFFGTLASLLGAAVARKKTAVQPLAGV